MVGVDASDSTDWCSPNAVDRPRACAQKMGAGLNPLGAAPGHYHTGPMHPSPTRPRATPAPDSDPPSNGRRAPPKPLRPTLLATVAAAPVALAVRAFRGTASSPTTMGRVLVHLAMLSTASGWQLPQSMAPEETITGEAHGGVDRRRLASACNGGWYVRPHARASPPCLTLLPSLVRSGTYGTSCACDSAAYHTSGCCDCDDWAFGGGCDCDCNNYHAASSCACDGTATHAAGHSTCTTGCTSGCGACPSNSYGTASMCDSWLACLGRAAKQPAPTHGAAAPAITHH